MTTSSRFSTVRWFVPLNLNSGRWRDPRCRMICVSTSCPYAMMVVTR